jgi:lysozyme
MKLSVVGIDLTVLTLIMGAAANLLPAVAAALGVVWYAIVIYDRIRYGPNKHRKIPMPTIPNPRSLTLIAGGITAALALIIPNIQQWEGYKTRPYKDVGGVLTVCNGHTGPEVVVRTYSQGECRAFLEKDVEIAAKGVLKITPSLFDKPYILASAISFSYNVGLGTYSKSSVARDFNAHKYKAGCADLLKYVKAGVSI